MPELRYHMLFSWYRAHIVLDVPEELLCQFPSNTFWMRRLKKFFNNFLKFNIYFSAGGGELRSFWHQSFHRAPSPASSEAAED